MDGGQQNVKYDFYSLKKLNIYFIRIKYGTFNIFIETCYKNNDKIMYDNDSLK